MYCPSLDATDYVIEILKRLSVKWRGLPRYLFEFKLEEKSDAKWDWLHPGGIPQPVVEMLNPLNPHYALKHHFTSL